ncbi:hypothetical protein [uncultured Maribacter sp.]|uniref:hypothetical protein n=1 Tax=uncultured Maribacter sp. TaxID=431308 RepID=UPI00263959BA|nr:hypothetical protein [uncultured Maribacter sp.]
MQIIEKYDRQFEYLGILINLLIAYQFYKIWSNPTINDASTVSALAALMAFEFIMVHSGVFMAVMPRKISLYVLFPVYGLFALAFNAATENNIILIAYLVVIFNRMRFAFSDVSPALKNRAILTSVLAAIIYFILIFVIMFTMNSIPELGLHEEYLEISGYNAAKTSGGVFIDTPHIAIFFGLIYYCFLVLIEVLLLYKPQNKNPPINIPDL